MTTRLLVHAEAPDAAPVEELIGRLKADGVPIVDTQRFAVLVEDGAGDLARAVAGVHGWAVTPEQTVPPPRTRPQIKRAVE